MRVNHMKSRIRRVSGAILACFAVTASAAWGQHPGRDVDAQATALAGELAKAPSVRQWFAAHPESVTPELAAAAEKLGQKALAAKDVDKAHPFSVFASFAFFSLGDRGRSLRNFLDERDEMFASAKTPAQYQDVRRNILQNIQMAMSIRRPDLAFAFSVLAADCSFFASTAKLGLDADEPLFQVVEDESDALNLVSHSPGREWLERLVSLVGDTSDKVIRTGLLGEQKKRMDPLLERLAPQVETNIPADFEFTTHWGSPKKTIADADALATLSYRYGSAAVARRRLSVAASRALQSHDGELWLTIVSNRYEQEREKGVQPGELQPLRETMRQAMPQAQAAGFPRCLPLSCRTHLGRLRSRSPLWQSPPRSVRRSLGLRRRELRPRRIPQSQNSPRRIARASRARTFLAPNRRSRSQGPRIFQSQRDRRCRGIGMVPNQSPILPRRGHTGGLPGSHSPQRSSPKARGGIREIQVGVLIGLRPGLPGRAPARPWTARRHSRIGDSLPPLASRLRP
jgi:hypothetical protein